MEVAHARDIATRLGLPEQGASSHHRLWHRQRARRTAFIFSGGGNRGAVQVGMLSALVELDFYPDMVFGSSIGALNGVAFAADPSRKTVGDLADLWLSISKDVVLPPQRFGATWRYAQRRTSVYPNTALESVIRDNLPLGDLADTVIPAEVVATKASTGEPRRISTGDPVKALLASSALPGALPPVELDGELYIDGGVSDDIPVLRAARMGATQIFVLLCGDTERIRSVRSRPIEAVLESFSLAKLARLRSDIAALGNEATVTVLHSAVAQQTAWLDFSKASDMLTDGYRVAWDALRTGRTDGRLHV